MGKVQLINAIANKMEVSKAEAERFMNAYMDCVKEALMNEEDVKLVGFGTFSVEEKDAMVARNPRNPEEVIQIPASNAPVFRAGKNLKEAVNK